MKKIGAFLAIMATLGQSTAFAWIGGPYSGNTYDGITGGIFTGVMRGTRLSGMFRFSQGADTYLNTWGDSIVYHRGITYYGEAFGWVDTEGAKVNGVTNGSNSGSGQIFDPSNQTIFRTSNNTGFPVYNSTSSGGSTLFPSANPRGAPTVANAEFSGKITSRRPSIRFKASGTASFVGDSAKDSVFNETAVTGPAATIPIQVPGVVAGNNTYLQVSTVNSAHPEEFYRVKIKVYGGRSSVTPAAVPADYRGN